MLIWCLQLGKAKLFGFEIFRSKMCCDLKFGVGKTIWGLIFLVCYCPKHFLSIKVFVLKKLV